MNNIPHVNINDKNFKKILISKCYLLTSFLSPFILLFLFRLTLPFWTASDTKNLSVYYRVIQSNISSIYRSGFLEIAISRDISLEICWKLNVYRFLRNNFDRG